MAVVFAKSCDKGLKTKKRHEQFALLVTLRVATMEAWLRGSCNPWMKWTNKVSEIQSISDSVPNAVSWTRDTIVLWSIYLAIAAVLALCRLFRNGQWRNWRHATGVIGCSVGLSYIVATMACASSAFVRNNQALVLMFVLLPALMGRKLHDQIIANFLPIVLEATIGVLEKFRGRSARSQVDGSAEQNSSGAGSDRDRD